MGKKRRVEKMGVKLTQSVVLAFVASTIGHVAYSFEIETHAAITDVAFQKSELRRNRPLLARLGLNRYGGTQLHSQYLDIRGDGVTEISKSRCYLSNHEECRPTDHFLRASNFDVYILPYGTQQVRREWPVVPTVKQWLMQGAVREDDNPAEQRDWESRVDRVPTEPTLNMRPSGSFDPDPHDQQIYRVFHHFYDPQRGIGLDGRDMRYGSALNTSVSRSLSPDRVRRNPDWALGVEDAFAVPQVPVGLSRNDFSLPKAKEALWRGLTGQRKAMDLIVALDDKARRSYMATAFRALGNVLHLNQDMAQPQHTRNDPHSGAGPENVERTITGHVSYIEQYARARSRRWNYNSAIDNAALGEVAQFVYDTDYQIPTLPTYASYWSTANGQNGVGKGLADFSSRNFFTPAKNLQLNNPLPQPVANTLAYNALSESRSVNGRSLRANYLAGTITDANTGSTHTVKMVATSAFLRVVNAANDPNFTALRIGHYLDEAVFDDQLNLLIPRAVAYSAGLINHFFRAELEVTPPAEGIYAILDHAVDKQGWVPDAMGVFPEKATSGVQGFKKIKARVANITPNNENMTGGMLVAVARYYLNTCYKDDRSGEWGVLKNDAPASLIVGGNTPATDQVKHSSANCRTAQQYISVSAPITVTNVARKPTDATLPATYEFSFAGDVIPINATDLLVQVLYRGKLQRVDGGNTYTEDDAIAVGAVDMGEPTYSGFVNPSDYEITINAGVPGGTFLTSSQCTARLTYPSTTHEYRGELGFSAAQPTQAVVTVPTVAARELYRVAVLGGGTQLRHNLRAIAKYPGVYAGSANQEDRLLAKNQVEFTQNNEDGTAFDRTNFYQAHIPGRVGEGHVAWTGAFAVPITWKSADGSNLNGFNYLHVLRCYPDTALQLKAVPAGGIVF
jgi:hypothetical protein